MPPVRRSLGCCVRATPGPNTVADHVSVLDEAVAQLPAEIALGHHAGDDPALVARDVVVRADSAGCTAGFLRGLLGPATSGSSSRPARTPRSHGAIFDAAGLEEVWEPAVTKTASCAKGRRCAR